MNVTAFDKSRRKLGETLASATYLRLRRDITDGVFPPRAKLRVRELCERYDVGMSPVREALNRLLRDGLVEQSDLQGFAVAPLELSDLAELTRTRCWINEGALREAIANGDAAWEEALLIAHHRLTRTPRWQDPDDPENVAVNPEWEVAHRAFHSSLIAACRSKWLKEFCEQLFDVADRYRNLARSPAAKRTRASPEHKAIMEAALARDADLAVKLLCAHFQRTADLGAEVLARLEKNGAR